MTTEQINELRNLALAATPGPWMYLLGDRFVYDRMNDGCRGNSIVGVDVAWAGNRNDLNYVAAANPAATLALIQQRDELLGVLELFMERVDEPPEANCSCHISPPCNDCVENWGLREAFSDAKEAIAKCEAQS
jgi:hypothetical protein